MAFGDVLNIGQADPPTLDLYIVDSLIALEHPVHFGARNRLAFVMNGHDQHMIFTAHLDGDGLRRITIFLGIRQQVFERTLHRDAAPLTGDFLADDVDPLSEQGDIGAHFFYQRHDVERRQL